MARVRRTGRRGRGLGNRVEERQGGSGLGVAERGWAGRSGAGRERRGTG